MEKLRGNRSVLLDNGLTITVTPQDVETYKQNHGDKLIFGRMVGLKDVAIEKYTNINVQETSQEKQNDI